MKFGRKLFKNDQVRVTPTGDGQTEVLMKRFKLCISILKKVPNKAKKINKYSRNKPDCAFISSLYVQKRFIPKLIFKKYTEGL